MISTCIDDVDPAYLCVKASADLSLCCQQMRVNCLFHVTCIHKNILSIFYSPVGECVLGSQ